MINKFECYIGETDTKEVKVKNSIDQPPHTTVPPLKPEFTATFNRLEGKHFPINKTIYFNENYGIEDEHGDFITTDLGFGIAGTTDSNGKLTVNCVLPSISITSPLDSANIALDVPFTFEATTNVQDGRSLIVVANNESYTVQKVLGVFEISGGGISESLIISSDDFSDGEKVILLVWYPPLTSTISTVDITARQATITNVTSTPASPEPATDFELSGESTYLVGKELTLQYSTDDATWLPLGVATVQGDGTWSKADCQIASAGSYYLRAVYDVDVVESASIRVTVESGVTLLSNISSETNIGNIEIETGTELSNISSDVNITDT